MRGYFGAASLGVARRCAPKPSIARTRTRSKVHRHERRTA
ncbi:hypothetical protein HMPREF3150_04104 [Pseudomonas aeruginosa]|nr:hypothetical protein HMPREF3150_04104 [Pseudomonas aeruginosa]